MAFAFPPLLPLIFLLMIVGASGIKWSVTYNQHGICALQGSTVSMNGSYNYPRHVTVTKAYWTTDPDKELNDMSKESDFSGRVEYFTDEQKHFSLKLSNVQKMDEKKYYFRIITNIHKERWVGRPGVQLKVTDLKVVMPKEVIVGGRAILKCETTCRLFLPTFIWYKNGHLLTTKTTNNQLHLQPVSSEDAGHYSCAINGYQHLPSPNQTLVIRWAFGAEWGVNYNQQEICALKGSTVFMNGSYTRPENVTVTEAVWIIDPDAGGENPDLSKKPDYSGRVEYFTDEKNKHFSLKLSKVAKKDENEYYFKIRTNLENQRWLGKPGVQLSVTDLQLEVTDIVMEGGIALLICETTCSLTDPTFIWYKNGRHLTTKTTINNQLHLQAVSSEDAGSYSCAVNGYQHLPSPNHTLIVRRASLAEWRVRYIQQKICALKGSTVVMHGDFTHPGHAIVTEAYWTIDPDNELNDISQEPHYSGRVLITILAQRDFFLRLSNVEKRDEKEYFFRIITDIETERWVGRPGIHLQVTDLHVESPDRVIEGGTALMICKTTCSLIGAIFIWYKNGHLLTTNPATNNQLHLQPVSIEDAGSYSCALYGYQHVSSPNHTLTVRYPPNAVSIGPSGEIVEDSSVTLTCSSDAYPPVENYTWFIEGGVSPVGSGHSYSPLQSGSYYCEARNEHGAQRSAPFLFRAKGSVTVYVVVAVVAGIIAVLLVLVWMRRKKQQRNTDEGYVNIYVSQRFSEDDTSNPPDYKNLEVPVLMLY
ncbi:B-cell receptor CD22-like isoform X2 [Hoplias malabaricus]|uniref:B-cell receptor CD22-like isoform X2 n=1 Tax=Hoplias malabaricus TaxID=27720 RepID=UPI0034626EFB